MSEGPWIRFFPSDWLAGTRGLTAAETGIYITLIAMMYERGEPIPADISRLARLCGTTTAALKSTLTALCRERKLTMTGGCLWNDRVDAETNLRREKSTSAQNSAKARWEKDKQNQSQKDASALQPDSERNANQKLEARTRDANASIKRDIEREFEQAFWPAYPLKVGKPAAFKAFVAARQRASLQAILSGAQRYAAHRLGQDKQFTKQAQGWLNRDGWNDELVSTSPQPTGNRTRTQAAADLLQELEDGRQSQGNQSHSRDVELLPSSGGLRSRYAASGVSHGRG